MGAIVFLGVLVILFVLWMIVRFIRVVIALNTNDPSPRQERLMTSVDNRLAKSGAYDRNYSPNRVIYTQRTNADGSVGLVPLYEAEAETVVPTAQPGWQPTPGQVLGAGVVGAVAGAALERHHQHRVEERQAHKAEFDATMDRILHPQHRQEPRR
jgi:hypothetical protein